MFLSATQIIAAVKEGSLRIAYYAIKKTDGSVVQIPEKRFVSLHPTPRKDEVDELIRDYFLRSLEPDSLAFHVGPYAAVEVVRRGHQRQFLKDSAGQHVFDVKTCGSLILYPGEFVLVGSNEYIETSSTLGASLFSNVRNTDIGLSHISTMIDPSWHGKLQIGIANPTRFSKELSYLDALSILRFHVLSESPPADIVDRFRQRRPHFGDDWWTIEAEPGRRFFQVRKEYAPGGQFAKRIRSEFRSERVLVAAKRGAQALGLASAVTALFFAAKLYNRIEDSADYRERIVRLEQQQDLLREMSKTFHMIKTGTQQIDFGDPRSLEFAVPFDTDFSSPPFVVVNVPDVSGSQYDTTVRFQSSAGTGKKVNAAMVRINVLDPGLKSGIATASWFVARPKGE